MNRLHILTLFLLITGISSTALTADKKSRKHLEITALGGVQVGGTFHYDEGDASLDPGPIVAGTLGWYVHGTGRVVASYSYQFTEVEITSTFGGGSSNTVGAGVGHLQFGGEIDFPVGGRPLPFAGVTLGAVHIKTEANASKIDWFFSSALYGGVKIPFSKHLGFRAQAKLVLIIPSGDTTSFCIEGHGCHVSIYVDAVFQGEFAGGLYVNF